MKMKGEEEEFLTTITSHQQKETTEKGPLSKENKISSSPLKGLLREKKESKIRVFSVFGSYLEKVY